MTLSWDTVTSETGHTDYSYWKFNIEGSCSFGADIDTKLLVPSTTNFELGRECAQTPAGNARKPLEVMATT